MDSVQKCDILLLTHPGVNRRLVLFLTPAIHLAIAMATFFSHLMMMPFAAAIVCDESIVGGGWGGVYFAHRRASLSKQLDTTICLFERSHRIGGRTYSVPIDGTPFTLDVGAYRYVSNVTCMLT